MKQTTLAAAVVAALALGVAEHAAASAYAASTLEITDLTVFITEDGTNPSLNATITSFQFTATNSATLNGTSATTGTGGTGDGAGQLSQNCGGTPGTPGAGTNDCNNPSPRVDPGAANAPGGDAAATLANNSFTLYGPGALTYSHSDSVIYQSELTGDGTTHTQQMAETEVQDTGDGNANAEITSSTGFVFDFTINGGDGITNLLALNFDATPYLEVDLSDPNFDTGNATANVNSTFTLTNGDDGFGVSWSPQGNPGNNCDSDDDNVVACAENADGADLNRNLSVSSENSLIYNPGTGSFQIVLSGLYNGNWTLAFNALTSTSVQLTTVPEPGALALLGIGLAGLGGVARRRKLA